MFSKKPVQVKPGLDSAQTQNNGQMISYVIQDMNK